MPTLVSKTYASRVLSAVPDIWPGMCLALLSGEPTVEAGVISVLSTEIEGDGYARADIAKADWSEPLGNAPVAMPLEDDLLFPMAETEWPEVSWIALMPTAESEHALIALELTMPVVVRSQRQLRVAAGLFALRHLSL